MSMIKSCQPMSARHADRWTISLSGDVDASSASGLRSLATLLTSCPGEVDVDLGGVTFIDSRGWASVRAAADAVTAGGSRVRIVNPSLAVRRLTDSVARVASEGVDPRPGHGGRPGLRLVWSTERPPPARRRPPLAVS
jgi:anti-anti-sigma factor